MIRQLNRVVEYLECLPVNIINMENTEADDVIGYCSKHLFKDNKTTILSTDKDFLQLVDETTRVYSPTKKKCMMNPKYLKSMEYTQRIFYYLECLTEISQTGYQA